MEEASHSPDVRQIDRSQLRRQPFPAAGRQDFRVFFSPDAHRRVHEHAAETTAVEVGGVLVGYWGEDENGPYVCVCEMIRAEATDSQFTQVTFTHETWARINRQMDEQFSELRIVGWYHSHPDFGVFLSDRDLFIHQHFFSNPGQIALVVDPVRKREGVFVWRDGRPVRCSHYWVGDRLVTDGSGSVDGSDAQANTADQADSDEVVDAEPTGPQSTLAGRPRPPWAAPVRGLSPTVVTGALLLLGFALGYLFRGLRSDWERLRLIEGTVAHYGLWKGLRPGLTQNLEAVKRELAAVSKELDGLELAERETAGPKTTETKAGEKPPLTPSQRRRALQDRLSLVQQFLSDLQAVYGLTEEEQRAVREQLAEKLAALSRVPLDDQLRTTADGPDAAGASGPQHQPTEKSPPTERHSGNEDRSAARGQGTSKRDSTAGGSDKTNSQTQ